MDNNNSNPNRKKQQFKNPLNKPPKFKFNIYWFYIALFAVSGIIWFTNSGDSTISREIDWAKAQKVLLNNDYSKINVVNKEFAEIYIKSDAISRGDTLYKDLHTKNFIGTENSTKNAFYIYKFGDLDNFRSQLQSVSNQLIVKDTIGVEDQVARQQIISSHQIPLSFETRKSLWDNSMFSMILSFVVLIVIWVVFFRMMRGGSGGGGGLGGGIFNVGKSKARLYDKENDTKITVADVAGLEGAKVEVMEIVDFLKKDRKSV